MERGGPHADAQSSTLITGINGSQAEIEAGRNPNVRAFSYKDNE